MSISTTQGDLKFFQPLDIADWADIRFSEDDPTAVLRDDGLENYILISLQTDKRAATSEDLPSNTNERLGWWGDIFEETQIGSKLWLRQRERLSPSIYTVIKKDVKEALQWMIDDDIVESFIVNVTRDTREDAPKNSTSIEILATQLDKGQSGYGYFFNWRNQILERT